jgi:YcaO-like protein with predicted kinase domain
MRPSGPIGRAVSYFDRVCPPEDTVARLRPHLAELGITRVARQTGLDTIGIPCFSAVRPNAVSLAVLQGKGLTDAAATASAIMEAAEFAIAERAPEPAWFGPADSLEFMQAAWFDPSRLLRFGERFDPAKPINWVAGRGLFSGRPVLIPRDVVRLDGRAPDLPGVSQGTNGLASGNTTEEAQFHGVCELIERDATTLWSLLPPAQQRRRAVAPASFGDWAVDDLAQRIRAAGLQLALFDLTSDIAVPTILALVGSNSSWRYFETASGTGTHPVPARAAVRAITEAAQSRLTAIAGARDDIVNSQYGANPDDRVSDLLAAPAVARPPAGLGVGTPLYIAADFARRALSNAGVSEPVEIALGGERYGIAVIRLVSSVLEDREANSNWRPGARAVTVLDVAA